MRYIHELLKLNKIVKLNRMNVIINEYEFFKFNMNFVHICIMCVHKIEF